MKTPMKRVIAAVLLVVMLLSNVNMASAVTSDWEFYGDYTDVAVIKDSNSCPSMQGLAVGSQMMYAIKTGSSDTKAVITMTDKDTGDTTTLKDASTGNSYFTGLDHANDMAVWGIVNASDNKSYSNIFVATTLQGSNAIVRYRRSGSNLYKVATYHLQSNGSDICATAMDVMKVDSDGNIHLITKWGQDIYTGTVHKDTGDTTIAMTKICSIGKDLAYIKGEQLNLSEWTNQGFGYYDNTLFVPLSGPQEGENIALHRSVVLVYNLDNVPLGATIYPTDYLAFRVTSSAYNALFEIESVDICSADKKLYFNTNRRVTTSDTNHDGISWFDGYTYTKPTAASYDNIKHFNAKFLPNGGTGTMAVQRINTGIGTALSKNLYTKTGYTFAGWTAHRLAQNQWYYTNGSTHGWYAEGAQPSGYSLYKYYDQQKVANTSNVHADTVEYTAQWTPTNYTVKFDANGGTGTAIADMSFTVENAGKLPANTFSKEGYTFAGWQVSGLGDILQPGTSAAQLANYEGKGNNTGSTITLVANWEANDYTVTWNVDGEKYTTTTVKCGEAITAPSYTVPEGYTFSGWTIPDTMPAENITLDATLKPNAYMLTFKDNAGNILSETSVEYGAAITYPSTEKEGYSFVSWDSDATTMPAGDLTITGTWNIKTYNVSLNPNSGAIQYSGSLLQTVEHGKTATWPIWNEKLIRHGYTSDHFNTERDGSGDDYFMDKDTGLQITNVTGDMTLYAQWDPILYTVNFLPGEGSGEAMSSIQFTVESKEFLPQCTYEKEGCSFEGWLVSGTNTKYSGNNYLATVTNAAGTGDDVGNTITLIAQWTPNSYTVTWNVDGEEYATTTVKYGEAITAPDYTIPEGHTFSGWDVPDTMPAENITLDATLAVKTCTVTLLGNGGEFRYANDYYDSLQKTTEYNSYVYWGITPRNQNRTGYTLNEFNTEPDGSGKSYFMDNYSGLHISNVKSDMTLYAQWKLIQYTAQFLPGEGTGEAMPDIPFTIESTERLPECTYTREGYTFKCWCPSGTGSMFSPGYSISTMVYYTDMGDSTDTTVKLIAQWEPNKHDVTFTINGEVYETVTGSYDQAITVPEYTVPEGYTFSGWDVPEKMPNEPITLDATLTVNSYNLTFQDSEGNILSKQTVEYGAEIEYPDTEKEGYTFEGWDGVATTMPAEDLTITGTWTVNTYKVAFTVDGQEYDTVEVAYGQPIPLPETDPEKEGYRFVGWKDVPETMPAKDLTIAADFAEQVTITYLRYDTDTLEYVVDWEAEYDKGETITLGYYYWNYCNTLGWDTNNDGIVDHEYQSEYTVTEDITMKPVLVPFYADVDLAAENAEFVDAEGNDITRIYAENEYYNFVTLTNHPTRKGYTFLGWYVDEGYYGEGECLVYTNEETGKKEVSLSFGTNAAATAMWEANTYNVTYTINGETYKTVPVKYGAAVTAPEYTIPEGHTFSGWDVPETMPAEDITLDATQTVNSYTVTFKVNGEIVKTATLEYGAAVEAPDYDIPVGHTFSGWDVPETMPAQNLTLDAALTVNSYTVTFTVNGEIVKTATLEYGAAVEAPNYNIPVGHSFSGWDVPETMPAQDLILDATLKINTYTVTFTVDGEAYKTVGFEYGAAVTAPEYTIPEGHTFSGWTVPDTMPAENITLDAALTINTYTVTWVVDGKTVHTETVEYGKDAVKSPAVPVKSYYTAAWSDDAQNVTSDLTITPVYTAIEYTIRFEPGEGATGDAFEQKFTAETKGNLPECPFTKEYHTFRIWSVKGYKNYHSVYTTILLYNASINLNKTVTMVPDWTVNKYNVTYTINGKEHETVAYDYGTAVTAPEYTIPEGHTFSGWDVPDTMPGEDITLDATLTINTYTVTWLNEAETVIGTEVVKYGENAANVPDVPKKDYYTGAWSADATNVTSDLTITPVYTAIEYTIRFEPGEGVTGDAFEQKFTAETKGNLPECPFTKEYHTFQIWSVKGYNNNYSSYSQSLLYFASVNEDKTVTMVPRWTANKYNVTYTINGEEYKTVAYTYGTAVTAPEYTVPEGHTFSGWDVPDTMPGENITLDATLTVNTYTVTWLNEEETVIGTEVVEHGKNAANVPDVPEKAYYTAAWSADAQNVTSDLTITPVYTAIEYTLRLVPGEGASGETITKTFTIESGDKIRTVENSFSKLGHAQNYWWLSGRETGDMNDVIGSRYTYADLIQFADENKTVTLVARWIPQSYIIHVVTGQTEDIPGWEYGYGGSLAWEESWFEEIYADELTREGYTFTGWKWFEDEAGTKAYEGTTMPAYELYAIAQWEINTYTVTWMVDGEEYTKTEVKYGDPIVKPADPTKEQDGCIAYTFSGWTEEIPEVMPAENLTFTGSFTEGVSHTGNNHLEGYKAPTCTEDGYSGDTYCECGEELGSGEILPATGHSGIYYFNGRRNSDTYSYLNLVFYCQTCKLEVHKASKYAIGEIVQEATCTSVGKSDYIFDFSNVRLIDHVSWDNFEFKSIAWAGAQTTWNPETKIAEARVNNPKNKNNHSSTEVTYENITETTHDVYHACCGALKAEGEAHDYSYDAEKHTCGCGAVEQITVRVFWNGADQDPLWTLVEDYGTTTTIPTGAAPSGYHLAGFAKTPDGEVFLENPEYTFTESIDLYPVFQENTYTVTFTVDGERFATTEATFGQAIPLPETDPEKEGYRFVGWKDVPETMPANENLTIEADFVEQVTITYLSYDTDTFEYVVDWEAEYDKGETITLGYYYWNYCNTLGWDTNDDGVVDYEYLSEYTVTEDITMKPVLVPFYADVDLAAENAEFVDAEGNDITRIYAENEYHNFVTLTNHPTRKGYTFLGWYVDQGYYGKGEYLVYTNEETGEKEVSLSFGTNATATAMWEISTYTVTFIMNGGEAVDGAMEIVDDKAIYTMTYGTTVGFPADGVVKEGHTLAGVLVNGEPMTLDEMYMVVGETVIELLWEANKYTVNWDTDGDGTIDVTNEVAYGQMPEAPAASKAADEQFTYTFAGWNKEIVAVTGDADYTATFTKTGWISDETGRQYIIEDVLQKTGWTEIDGSWYYLDTETGYAATGAAYVPYNTDLGYGPDQDAIDSMDKYPYDDVTESWFIFDENGVFQSDYTGFYELNGETVYAVNGELPWLVGLVEVEGEYYYFGAPRTMIKGQNLYLYRTNDIVFDNGAAAVQSGMYTFTEDGKLLKAEGITNVNGTLYYYENYRLMAGKGLIKVDGNYYYVRSNGALVVGTEYWVANVNEHTNIPTGTYTFDENGVMQISHLTKNGIYQENGKWYYYVDGMKAYAGMISYTGNWIYEDGTVEADTSWIYVRSNGQLATGRYWITATNGNMDAGYYNFDAMGKLIGQKNGIVEVNGTLYYYKDDVVQYNAGLINLNGNYYYVRSNGVVVAGQGYWITNVGTTGIPAGYYEFGADGVMVLKSIKNGVVEENGVLYYYENGSKAYAGLIEYDGGVIYVRSNGQLAIGKYWVTKTNGLKDAAEYTFGADGKMINN